MINIPIQMFCAFDTDGKITPLRFRFKTEKEELITVENIEIVRRSENTSVLSFVCKALWGDRMVQFEVFYRLSDRRWFLKNI